MTLPIPLRDVPPAAPEREAPAAAPRALLAWTLKTCLVVGAMGFGTAHYLSRTLGGTPDPAPQRVVANIPDPETTGSLGGSAAGVRLDPCRAAPGLRGAQ